MRLDRALRRVPRRLAVAGTRGKSGVTRLIAGGLRASGARVLAKTTGSRSVLILPDGSEREIPRAGPASIREQLRLVALAADVAADTLVAELMGIGGECLSVEARRILRPGTLAVTNVRLDHLDDMGRDKAGIASTLAEAIPEGACVFVPEEDIYPAFEDAARQRGSVLRAVAPEAEGQGPESGARRRLGDFEPNRRLALAVLASLGIDRPAAERGMAVAAPDPGSLRVWRGTFGDPPRAAVCVSLFAANEPESSAAALAEARRALPSGGGPLVGILSLREDRGDRTLQWIRAAGDGFFREFAALALVGPPARATLRKMRRRAGSGGPAVSVIDGRSPEDLMNRVMALAPGEPVIIGLGNFVGPGDDLARLWDRKGTAHAA